MSSAQSKLRSLAATMASLLLSFVASSQQAPPASAAPSTPSAPPAAAVPPSNPPQTDAQRKAFAPGDKSPLAVVNAFNQMAFFDHEPVAAMKKYLADDFVEHYPDFASNAPGSDKEETIRFFQTRGWKKGEQNQDFIYQVLADKDRVAVFHNTKPNPSALGTAWVDIFRVRNGLIVEHWGVGQPVSPKISARHNMF